MKIFKINKVARKTGFYALAVLGMVISSCTDLDEGVYDRFVASEFYRTEAGINAALADIYKEIRGDWNGVGIAGADRGWYDLNETCTDEMMIPQRSDGAWADNGIWQQMYLHTWTSGQSFIQNTWDWLFRAVFKANLAIELLTEAGAPEASIAEAKMLRAYFYYLLMDGWGNVPIVTSTKTLVEDVVQSPRADVYDFVVSEITANVDQLSTTKGGAYYNRFNIWAGYMVLAKVYLNAEVYSGTEHNEEAIDALDKIITEGGFSLVSGDKYLARGTDGLFGELSSNQEVLFAIYVDALQAPRNIIGIRSLYGTHGQALFGFSTWNGATVHQAFVNKYSASDTRKAQWLLGPQLVPDRGDQNGDGIDDDGNDDPDEVANYALNISSITSAGIQEGARNSKFLPVAPYTAESSSNDFPAYRYADVLLMMAEALVRDEQVAAANDYINEVRNRAGLADIAGVVTLDEIYDERGRELAWEGHRRQDMIRFGKFLEAHDFKPVSDPKYRLFPIPASARAANPTLDQNPGY